MRKSQPKPTLLFLVAIYFCSFLDPSFALPDERMVEGAKKEAELVLYSGITVADGKALLEAFERKYPFIKARHQRSSGARLISQIQIEHRTQKYLWDVYLN